MLRKYRFTIAMLVLTVLVALVEPTRRAAIAYNTIANLKEMLSIIPPIFLLLGLMDVWVPRETFVKYMGPGSGLLGASLAILIGALAAGPLYGAFPVASMMLRKGVSFKNVMILLGAWSTLKIPQILFETASLGARFSLARMAANIPVIFAIAYIVDLLLSESEKELVVKRQFAMEAQAMPRHTGTPRGN